MSHVVTLIRDCGEEGNGWVRIAFPWTRKDVDVLLELDDSRDRRSRTISGVSMRWVYVIVRS